MDGRGGLSRPVWLIWVPSVARETEACVAQTSPGVDCFRFAPAGPHAHNVTGLADDPFKGNRVAFGTFDVGSFIRAKKDFFKKVAALKASKFKNGHDLLPNLLFFIVKDFSIKAGSHKVKPKLL